jgi:predicted molibdopterin-dependent oxidoreductase YjgC
MKENSIIINENRLSFEPGETILDVADRHHIQIPTLCHLKHTTPTHTCRVCIVEIQGRKDLVESCVTAAEPGMVIQSESSRVVAERRKILAAMLATGNHNCAIRDMDTVDWTAYQMSVIQDDGKESLCPAWGDCELQNLTYRYQVRAKDLPIRSCSYETERANPFIIRDFSRCILCGRCIKACREIQVNNAIEFGYHGQEMKIIAGDDRHLKDSDCVFCGECLQACPVGALIPDREFRDDRFTPTTVTRTTCSFCGVGCQMDVFVQDNTIVKIDGADPDLPPNNASLCVKGRFGYDFVSSPERLTTPLIKRDGKQVKASWDEALDLVASNLSRIKSQHGPDKTGFLTSARVTNEDNYIAMKFTRGVLKTNNIDHCARL